MGAERVSKQVFCQPLLSLERETFRQAKSTNYPIWRNFMKLILKSLTAALIVGVLGLGIAKQAKADPAPQSTSASFSSRSTQVYDPTSGIKTLDENVQLGSTAVGNNATTVVLDGFGVLFTGGTGDGSALVYSLGSILNQPPVQQPEPQGNQLPPT